MTRQCPEGPGAVASVLGLCRQVAYRVPGDHTTWDAYHEGQHVLAAAIESALDPAPAQPQGDSDVLGFAESLMLMEGLDRVAAELRDRAAAGDASAQEDLELADALGERLAQATSIELTRTLAGAP